MNVLSWSPFLVIAPTIAGGMSTGPSSGAAAAASGPGFSMLHGNDFMPNLAQYEANVLCLCIFEQKRIF